MKKYSTLSNFHIIRPKHQSSQEVCLDWLVSAHTKAEEQKGELTLAQTEAFKKEFSEEFMHVGCKPDKIHSRGHELSDFLHKNWENMDVYNLDQHCEGIGQKERQEIHLGFNNAVFEQYYPKNASPPAHLIHVSCTGYASPSSAQMLVSKRGWGKHTQVTHAYHMGCYASVPAIRMAASLAFQDGIIVDIVHTELCSLHCNPSLHEIDQMVLQSLFADGYIKYSVGLESSDVREPVLKVIGLKEQLIPDSAYAMTWKLTNWGFQGYLSKKIPVLIARHVAQFIYDLCEKYNVERDEILSKGIFAIHPGGPKILDHIQSVLGLEDFQFEWSRKVLQNYGNISSATLPHIWKHILDDSSLPPGTLVMSLAFGPGLNIAGAILEKSKG